MSTSRIAPRPVAGTGGPPQQGASGLLPRVPHPNADDERPQGGGPRARSWHGPMRRGVGAAPPACGCEWWTGTWWSSRGSTALARPWAPPSSSRRTRSSSALTTPPSPASPQRCHAAVTCSACSGSTSVPSGCSPSPMSASSKRGANRRCHRTGARNRHRRPLVEASQPRPAPRTSRGHGRGGSSGSDGLDTERPGRWTSTPHASPIVTVASSAANAVRN